MADRDNYRGYGSPSGRYYEGREYDRGYGNDRNQRDERSWFGNDRDDDRGSRDRSRDDGRGFFERAGEEVRSWFGGDDDRGGDRHRDRDRDEWRSQSRDQDRERNRGYGYGTMLSGQGGRDRNFRQDSREPWGGGDRAQRYGSGGDETSQSRYGGSSGYAGRFQDRGGYGTGQGGMGSGDYGRNRSSSHPHDEHYNEWRQQQMDALDRDYDEYRRENRDKFHNEFSSWRSNRQQQRSSMQNVREHMDVVGSDGEHVGTVDRVAGDRIILTKSDASAGGHHHSIPCSWIQSVDDKVTINKSAQQARQQWQDEENRRALFEKDDQRGGEGAHMLNRSFSGTYEDQ
jgi:hypothetical protein